MEIAVRNKTTKYRFFTVAENDVTESPDADIERLTGACAIPHAQDPRQSQNFVANRTKIEYGFLFQLVGTSQLTLGDVQLSSDDPIHINQISARKVAVYRYSGAWSELRCKRMLLKFLSELRRNHVETMGDPVFNRREDNNELRLRRRNEIWFEVAR